MNLRPEIENQIVREWESAPYGYRSKVVEKWAKLTGYSYQTIYRALSTDRKRKKGDYLTPGIEDAARKVALIKKRPPVDKGEISTDQAIQLAIQNRLIDPNFAEVSVATFNRVIQDLGLNQRKRRISRFQAQWANQLHHVDASSSNCFYVDDDLPGGDYLLKLFAGSKGYKNKPVKVDRLRPWIYGVADDYSGVHAARYVVADGESLSDNLDFLSWAWSKKDESLFFGLPERIKGDHGPMMKGKVAQSWFSEEEGLGIKIEPSVPREKDAHGKIERPWRTMWQRFELTFFAESDWKDFEITLSELQRRFLIYQQEYNARPHRFQKKISRMDAWRKSITEHGGAVALSENAIRGVVRRYDRTVGQDGSLSLGGKIYEVKGLHCAKVYVYEGVFDNEKIIVEDKKTGQKYEVEDFTPLPLDTFHSAPETPHQKAVKEAATLGGLHNTLYQETKDQGKVTPFPTRIKETREIENPFDVGDAYPSLQAAMEALTAILGAPLLAKDGRKDIEKLILDNGLSRKCVSGLAEDLKAFKNERTAQ
ncbi:MAG: hypothetical protein JXK94_02140 [Deltaproteobacteria bacterium]|nr:hypothetical protein [Deltaproteobacteria bacterium]